MVKLLYRGRTFNPVKPTQQSLQRRADIQARLEELFVTERQYEIAN